MSNEEKEKLSISYPVGEKKRDGKIRQSFSHGRSKVVTVEVKKKRVFTPVQGVNKLTERGSNAAMLVKKSGLTNAELENRIKVVKLQADAQKIEAQKRAIEAEESFASKMEEIKSKQSEIEAKNIQESKTTDDKTAVSDEKKGKPSNSDANTTSSSRKTYDNKRRNDTKAPFTRSMVRQEPVIPVVIDHAENARKISKISKAPGNKGSYDEDDSKGNKKNQVIKRDKDEIKNKLQDRGRISIYNALDENDGRTRSLASIKRAKEKNKQKNMDDSSKIVREVLLHDTITVQELSNRMAVRVGDLIKALMKMGIMATINQIIDADTAELIVLEMGHKVKRIGDEDLMSDLINKFNDKDQDMLSRPPIVTIMGHVDHGKTSLLDAIRKTDVALNESGGITQHIGAYQITMRDSRKITFIDTPGHAAFTEMRARGANSTDVVVLVVAADDGVKEQTIEALNHAKAADVPIIVAINKMDKQGANPSRVRTELLNHGIVVESLGGDVIDVEISAKSGINLDKLEESILLQAEMLELKANPNRNADAVIIESRIEKGLGPIATILVKGGTVRVGDIFVSGSVYGKVRAIRNDCNQSFNELLPGAPGEIIGFNAPAIPGDDFLVVSDESKAKEIAEIRDRKKREKKWVVKSSGNTSISDMFTRASLEEKLKSASIIIKADTQGSIEAISDSLRKLITDEVSVNIIHSGVGGITENDVILSKASSALILGFNVRANTQAKEQSLKDKIDIKYYSVIYDLIDDIKSVLSGLLSPTLSEKVIGAAEVRQLFEISKAGKIAGCMVTDGIVKRNAKIRLLRDNVVVHTGDVKSIRKKKDDVKEVKNGFECGISLESYSDIHIGDVIEFFEIEEIARQL